MDMANNYGKYVLNFIVEILNNMYIYVWISSYPNM